MQKYLLWLPIIAAAGEAVGWFMSQRKAYAEIRNLNTENQKLNLELVRCATENLEKLQERRASYNRACQACEPHVSKMLSQMQNDGVDLPATRNEFCAAIHHGLLCSFADFVEFEHVINGRTPDQLKCLIAEQVVPELRRVTDWLNIINGKRFVVDHSLAPAKISKRTLIPFHKLLDALPVGDGGEPEATMLRNALGEMIDSGLRNSMQ